MSKLSPNNRTRMLNMITGFEMEVQAWRDTVKLSQNKPADERGRIIAGLEQQGSVGMAEMIRGLAS